MTNKDSNVKRIVRMDEKMRHDLVLAGVRFDNLKIIDKKTLGFSE